MLLKIIQRKKKNLNSIFLRQFAERGFLAQATDIEQIDKLENIENVKGSDDKDHIIGSAGIIPRKNTGSSMMISKR